MSTQYETVNVTIGGANPQTIPVTVSVDTSSGSGNATFSYIGNNGGSDSIQGTATIAGNSYTSNTAQVNWQQTNGNIQIGDVVTCYAWGDSPHSGPVAAYIWKNPADSGWGTNRTINDGGVQVQTNNSFAFDAFRGGAAGDTVQWSSFNSAGQQTSIVGFPTYGSNFNCIIMGNLLIPAAGSYVLNITYKDGVNWGIGNSATGAVPGWANKGSITGDASQTMTVNGQYPLLPAPQNNGSGGFIGSNTQVVTFPQAGVYPIEVNWDYWFHSGRVMHLTSSSGELAPVSIIAAPAPSSPSGNLTITPGGGSTNLQVTGQPITLTVNVSGITYPTKSYCPVLEGTSGKLYIYNDPSNPTFSFPTFNGNPVDKTAAAGAIFGLTSNDNTAYQGLFSVGYDGTNFTLNYNGNTANSSAGSRVLSTSLVIVDEDIAWYNSSNKTFDTFNVSGSTGGKLFNIEVDYMNKPSVASISPTSIPANGSNNTISISLTKAFSPQQQGAKNTGNTVNCSISVTGAQATGTPQPILDSAGWLTGWNVQVVGPVATTNQTLTLNMNVSGTLTYLSGDTFVTNTVTYINGAVGTITANGQSFVAPAAVGFSVNPAGPDYTSLADIGSQFVATAQVFTAGTSDPLDVEFFAQPVGGSFQSVRISMGIQSSSPATINGVSGYLQTYGTFVSATALDDYPGDYLGFTATNLVSNLTCTYTTSGSYWQSSGSGGGGGGCPAIEMYLLPELKVEDVEVGMEVDAILNYKDETKLPVQWLAFSDEVCYRFEAENGAAVIVSESTPVPTRETVDAALASGSMDELPQLAPSIRAGMHVLTNIDGKVEWSMLVETVRLGVRPVARIFIGGENFAAGEVANKRIYTHNISLTPFGFNIGSVK
jgi:hypothetical protein